MRVWLFLAPILLTGLVVHRAETADARALEAWEERARVRIRPGDLVFQELACGERCALIAAITQSRYVHVGVVVDDDGERAVMEALGPVGVVPLDTWAARGVGRDLAVYRPSRALADIAPRVERAMQRYAGRPYDALYQWDDARIYCSELVAKAYRDVLGHDLFTPRPVWLGRHATRVAALSGGALREGTPMVTPRDLTLGGDFVRVIDALAR